jgi:outer membrane lipase/esterase
MRTFKRSLLAGAVALAVSAPAAAQFTNAIFFGDSVTDSGNYISKGVLPPGTGKFTTNPGPVWSEVFAASFGLTALPSSLGGTNYAWGGARITELPGVVDPPLNPFDAVPIATQVAQFIAKGPLDPNAIYSLQGGGNDFFFQFALLLSGKATPAQVQAALGAAAVNLGTQAAILRAAGARYIMVWTAPDMGTLLSGAASGQGPQLTALANFFNTTLFSTLNATGVQAIRLNGFALQNEVLRNPGLYGLSNVTGVACTLPANITIAECNASTLVSPDAPNTYFFANGSHPTTAMHKILGEYAVSFIEGPQQISTLVDVPFRVEDANFRELDGRMWSSLDAPGPVHKLEAWVAYDYGHVDMQAGPFDGSYHGNSVAVGGDMKLSERTLVGMMFDYTETRGNFGGPGGGFTLKQPVFTLYAGYGEGPWYFGATAGAGSLDYSDINRNIALGPATRNESGQANGYEYTFRGLGGYWFKYQDVLHGPYARVTYTKAIVHQFSESGSDSLGLTYGQQDNDQLLWSLGWQVAGRLGAVRPWARATWEYDSLNNDRTVTASSNTLGGTYTVPGVKPDNNYVLFNVGAATDFGGVTGYISGSGTAARSDGNYWAVTVGLRMPI